MEFKDLKIGDPVYILENAGTFRKITTFNIGRVVSVSTPYDDNTIGNQYMAQMLKKKLVDINISCEGIQKKLTVGSEKDVITDNAIGLTVATDKQQLISLVESQSKEYEAKIASIQLYKDELEKCYKILSQLKNEQPSIIEQEHKTELIRVS